MGRQHSLHNLKDPGLWMFCFPALPLLLFQSPMQFSCDKCGEDFLHRSPFRWFFRLLLLLTSLAYSWVIIEVAKDFIG